MEINKIQYFIHVYETGSMRKAAEFINMSAGSLSKSIKSLEEELGVKLFKPDGRNIIPTNDARDVYLKAKKLVQSYEDLLSNDATPMTQNFTIASFEVFTTYFISKFIDTELGGNSLNINVLEKVPGQIEDAIISGSADIGITYAPIAHPELDFLKVTKVSMGLFGLKKYLDTPLYELIFSTPVTQVEGSITNLRSLDGWPEHIERKVHYRFEMLETALELSRRGKSVIYAPKFIIKLQNEMIQKKHELVELKPEEFKGSNTINVYLVIRKNQIESPIIKKLAKSLRLNCF